MHYEFGGTDILIILFHGVTHTLKTISLEPKKIIQLLKFNEYYKVILTPNTQIMLTRL